MMENDAEAADSSDGEGMSRHFQADLGASGEVGMIRNKPLPVSASSAVPEARRMLRTLAESVTARQRDVI